MNFYFDSGGVVLHVEPERIFQGSANANTIRFIGAFASNLPVLVAFKLPNGVWTTPQSMGFSAQLSGVETNDGVQFNTWEYQIPQVITENYGTVNVQFYVYGDAGGTGGQIASAMSSFVVEKGVPITLPDPTDDYQTLLTQILAVLSQIQSEIGDLPNNYVPKASGSNVAYINDQNGGTATKPFAVDVTNNALVARDGNGQIRVPLAPLQGYDATSKNYVDESIEALPSKYVTLDTDQTIDGTKGFTSPITVGGQTWRTSYMKDSFVYTVDGYSYEVTYPEKSGLMALKSDIPTDYATQGQLAQTNQNVEDLYTILEQAQVVTVTTLEQAYTTRETADGENIVDGVQTTVKEIRGKTVATTNQFSIANLANTDYLTVSGKTITVTNRYDCNSLKTLRQLCPDIHAGTYTASVNVSANTDLSNASGTIALYSSDGLLYLLPQHTAGQLKNVFTLSNADLDRPVYFFGMSEGTVTWDKLMVLEGDWTDKEIPAYSDWFAGLKNSFFKEIVSTGRNLFGLTADDFKNGTIDGGGKRVNLKLTPNTQYTLSTNTPIYAENTASIWFNGGNSLTSGVWVNQPRTATTDENGKLYITIRTTEIDTIFNSYWIMLNIGTTATAYEPYISDALSAATPIELAEYDVAYPETGETKRQSYEKVFDGTEGIDRTFKIYDYGGYPVLSYKLATPCERVTTGRPVANLFNGLTANELVASKLSGVCMYGEKSSISTYLLFRLDPAVYGCTMDSKDAELTAGFEAWISAQAEKGNPLTVTYKTAEATTEATPFNKSKYIAWKNGSETIEQGETDNSEYGAENTVKQDYFTLTGGTTNV